MQKSKGWKLLLASSSDSLSLRSKPLWQFRCGCALRPLQQTPEHPQRRRGKDRINQKLTINTDDTDRETLAKSNRNHKVEKPIFMSLRGPKA
jgi:hypothetical protein